MLTLPCDTDAQENRVTAGWMRLSLHEQSSARPGPPASRTPVNLRGGRSKKALASAVYHRQRVPHSLGVRWGTGFILLLLDSVHKRTI